MTTPVSHPLVGAYLRDLDRLLHGVEPGERAEVLAGVHEHLDATLPAGASDSDVRRTLTELGSPQSVADEAYASHPPMTFPERRRPSPWLAQVACVLNALMLVLVLWLALLQPHVMEWIGLAVGFAIPWFFQVVLTSMSEVWSSADRFRSIFLVPATVTVIALSTSLITGLIGWMPAPLVVTAVVIVLAAAWVLLGLVRSAQRSAS